MANEISSSQTVFSNKDTARNIISYLPLREIPGCFRLNRSIGAALSEDRIEYLAERTHASAYDIQNYPKFLLKGQLTEREMDLVVKDIRVLDLKGMDELWVLTEFSGRCQKVVNLSLPGMVRDMSDDLLIKNAPSWKELEELDLSHCNHVTDRGLSAIAEHCPRLTTLSLGYCYNITAVGRGAIAQQCPGLKKLILQGHNDITEEELQTLAPLCPHLTHISLSAPIDIEGLKTAARHCSKLATIVLSNGEHLSLRNLRALFEEFPQIMCIVHPFDNVTLYRPGAEELYKPKPFN